MAGNSDRARKLLVRTALVTGSTVATLVGAQSLFVLDQLTTAQTNAVETETNPTPGILDSNTPAVVNTAPQLNIIHRAPSLLILRQAGTSGSQTTSPSTQAQPQTSIRPPQPQQLAQAAPPPSQGGGSQQWQPQQQIVVVQPPAPAQTGSSR